MTTGAAPIALMSLPLVTREARAFFAPVNRATGTPTLFDPAQENAWVAGMPPAPWLSLGCVTDLIRSSESKVMEIDAGVPATAHLQARPTLAAVLALRFQTWTKLSMALATGSQHMNLLVPAGQGIPAIGSGAKGLPALACGAASTASTLYLAGAAAAGIEVGSMVAVDLDYAGQVGFVGSGVSAAYVRNSASVGGDPDYVRRVSFNTARVTGIGGDGGLQLGAPLIAGSPTAASKVQQILGFVDREGGSFFQEWSALFVYDGVQGDRLCFHYPRLQACQGSAEVTVTLAPSLSLVQPEAKFRALSVTDGNDGEQVLCYRSYFPGKNSVI